MDGIPQENAVNLFFYETGCLLFDQSQYSKGEYALPNANSSLSRKIAGHSLSFLSQRTWGNFYGPMTTYAREYVLTELLLRLPLACALDEMEEFLAKARVSDMNVFQHAWREIAKRYRFGGTSEMVPGFFPLDDAWLYSPSLWSLPLSNITDAIALIAVLGVLPLGNSIRIWNTLRSDCLMCEKALNRLIEHLKPVILHRSMKRLFEKRSLPSPIFLRFEGRYDEDYSCISQCSKLAEFRSLAKGYPVFILGLQEIGYELDIEETGETFDENALIKAQAVHRVVDDVVMADDSGLCVGALDGAPGIMSARFGGLGKGDDDKNTQLLATLEQLGDVDRVAAFIVRWRLCSGWES